MGGMEIRKTAGGAARSHEQTDPPQAQRESEGKSDGRIGFIANSEHAVAHVVPVLEHYANVSPERVWLAGGRIGVTYLRRRTSSFARQIAAERCEGPRIGCRWRGQ